MRALLRGERHGTLVQILTLTAVILLAGGSLALNVAYRISWRHAQRGEYQLCVQRETYDLRMHALEQADVTLMRSMIASDERFPLFAKVRIARDRAFLAKERADEVYLATPVVDGCELVRP